MLTNPAFWAGVVFAGALVAFLAYTVSKGQNLNRAQQNIIKFLAAICAGAAAAFISGSAIFDASWTGPAGKVAISGTSGVALFFVVFFFFDRTNDPDDGVEFDIPENCNFRQALDQAAQLTGGVTLDYTSLTPAELAQPLAAGHITSRTFPEFFEAFQLRTKQVNSIRRYKVTETNNLFRFVIT
ncbi:MAG TPA: hypothetical protein VK722_04290 [Candidatus Aquilonibacter sp.]|jgi:hypothetical protein|nr:hypothetical protein [Candidatus Aquilonibacter sp.]